MNSAFRLAYWCHGFPLSTLLAACRSDGFPPSPWRLLAAKVCKARAEARRRLSIEELEALAAPAAGWTIDEADARRCGLAAYYAKQIVAALGGRELPIRISRCETINDVEEFARQEGVELATWHETRMAPVLGRMAALGIQIDLFGPPWPTEITIENQIKMKGA